MRTISIGIWFFLALLVFVFIVPVSNVTAQTPQENYNIEETGGLIRCGKGANKYELAGTKLIADEDGKIIEVSDPDAPPELKACDFQEAGSLLVTVVDYVMFIVAPTLVIVILSIGGFMLLTAGGYKPDTRKKAQKMMLYAIVGYLIILCSVLIIDEFINIIGVKDDVGLAPQGEDDQGWRDFDKILGPPASPSDE